MAIAIEPARPADLDDVLALVSAAGLPLDGLRDHLLTTFVARDGGTVVGSAALELYADGALLRSVAVAPDHRGRGIGAELTAAAIALATARRAPALYLLTTTAERYFPKAGFEIISRADVPTGVRASIEFTSACPSTATVMRKPLFAGVSTIAIRAATLDDLPALTDVYNHYVINTTITFDLHPFTPDQRRAWFDDHSTAGRHRLLVAADGSGLLGYATTSRWRPKRAYDTTVESSVYCRPDAVGRGIGTALYTALFQSLEAEDVHAIVAGIALPNPASVSFHERFGFRPVGIFQAVGRKFDRYWDVAWFQRPLAGESDAHAKGGPRR